MAKDNVKKEIIVQMVAGKWEEALPRSIYSPLNSWFKRHNKEKVIVRIVIYDTEADLRFACHFKCNPGGKVDKIFLPFNSKPSPINVLSIPSELYKYPVYCLPDDTLVRAAKKKARTKKLKE